MKKTKLTILAAGVTSLLLTACGPSEPVDFTNYFQIDQSKYKVTFNELRLAAGYSCEANQKGDVRALVVPVEFADYPSESLPAGKEGTRDDINIAMFGDPTTDKELGWESLHSFYWKSSYEQCNITGYTADWYKIVDDAGNPLTAKEFEKTSSTNKMIHQLHDYYFEGEGKKELDEQGLTLSDFDANNDGFADLVLTVYSCPQGNGGNGDSIFWAYTTQTDNKKGAKPETAEDALFSRYWWCSYDFMYKDTVNGSSESFLKNPDLIAANADGCIDTHTFIHETGHGLGLADYYSYDYNKDAPMGGIDMMDNNIGDHNAYSKALYGWISPYVVTGNARITIKPFEQNGDSIIVPIREFDWANNPYGYTLLHEYLIIQYDTPEGLAYADGKDSYAGSYPLYYNIPGIRVLHTDSRMGAWYWDTTSQSKSFAQYVKRTKLNDPEHKYIVDFAHDNTLSRTANGNRLLQVVHPDGKNHIKGITHNEVLWQEGTKLDNYVCNTMNEVTETPYNLGFSIEVVSITPEGATLEFRTVGETAESK